MLLLLLVVVVPNAQANTLGNGNTHTSASEAPPLDRFWVVFGFSFAAIMKK
jgi:hypothetical protein